MAKVVRSDIFKEKEKIVKRINERIASIVRNAGTQTEEYIRFAGKISRPGSPYREAINVYDPQNIKLQKNIGTNKERTEYAALSRSASDIEAMDIRTLKRLEAQTKGWGAVKKEAKQAIKEQRELERYQAPEYNPFIDQDAAAPQEAAAPEEITAEDIKKYLNQKEAVRQFIEGHDEAFYALIEITGWDDIREHTTEEIFKAIEHIDMATYEFDNPLSQIGSGYITRRDASREHRRALGIL